MNTEKKMGWRDIPIGGIIDEGGTALKYKSGEWRTKKPMLDRDKCKDCFTCWINCPDSSILVKDESVKGIDYFHCKGCGICASVCPSGAITMKKENDQ